MKSEQRPSIASLVVGPIETNCYILSCARTSRAIIVDPGGDPEAIESFLRREHLEPQEIICTHGHSDHIAAVAALKSLYGIPFAIHEADIEVVNRSVLEAPAWGLGTIEAPKVDRLLAPGDTVGVGEIKGKVLHTPGHTPGGISLLIGDFVVVGDTLFCGSIGRTDFYGGDLQTLLESIRGELLSLPDETIVYCGHGPSTSIGRERRENPFLRDDSL